METKKAPSSLRLLGADVTALTMAELLEEIGNGVAAGRRRVIAHHNLHSLYLFQKQKAFRDFYVQCVAYAPIDGMPLIPLGRLYGERLSRHHRLTYVDLLPKLLDLASQNHWRLFYLGSRPEACARGIAIITQQHPEIELQATHGYFDATRDGLENRATIAQIAAFRPDILLVGMGMPRQELWIADNLDQLDASVILPCGAAIDYIAGAIPTPPRWAGRVGLEWLFRLFAEPRRLGARYLVEPWHLLGVLGRDLLHPHGRSKTGSAK